jgi:hypothetical protein
MTPNSPRSRSRNGPAAFLESDICLSSLSISSALIALRRSISSFASHNRDIVVLDQDATGETLRWRVHRRPTGVETLLGISVD